MRVQGGLGGEQASGYKEMPFYYMEKEGKKKEGNKKEGKPVSFEGFHSEASGKSERLSTNFPISP